MTKCRIVSDKKLMLSDIIQQKILPDYDKMPGSVHHKLTLPDIVQQNLILSDKNWFCQIMIKYRIVHVYIRQKLILSDSIRQKLILLDIIYGWILSDKKMILPDYDKMPDHSIRQKLILSDIVWQMLILPNYDKMPDSACPS